MKSFVRFEYNEELQGKKELLSAQINLLDLLKKLRSYKSSRKRELILKNKLKVKLTSLQKGLDDLESYFPSDREKPPKEKPATTHRDIEKGNIKRQLLDIQKKLAKLQ
jgi:hypothetical protein